MGLAGVVAMSACSGDPVRVGVDVIEGDLADQIGLGTLEAICDEPEDQAEGTEFGCTATTEDGEVIEIRAVFDSEDEIFVYPTNVVTDSEMSSVEAEAAQLLGQEIGIEIDPADVACPAETTVLAEGGTLECEIVDRGTGNRFVLVATFGGHIRGEGFQQRNYVITDEAS